MSARLERIPARVRVPAALALIVAGACLVSWGAFVLARGMPAECGGDAPPCPPGSTSGTLGIMASLFVLLPLGVLLAGLRRPETLPAAVALTAAGAAAGVWCSRFVADPITDEIAVTWWFTAAFGAVAAVAAAIALVLLLRWPRRA